MQQHMSLHIAGGVDVKGKTQIRMDFAKAKADAGRLDGIASHMKSLANDRFDKSMLSLYSAWSGENSRQFLQKEERIKEKLLQNARELQNIAADIRRVAKRVHDAEMRAYDIASRRKS